MTKLGDGTAPRARAHAAPAAHGHVTFIDPVRDRLVRRDEDAPPVRKR